MSVVIMVSPLLWLTVKCCTSSFLLVANGLDASIVVPSEAWTVIAPSVTQAAIAAMRRMNASRSQLAVCPFDIDNEAASCL